MLTSKRLSPVYCFAGMLVLFALSGCQSTGTHTAHGRGDRDHFAGKAEQFDPDLPGSAHAKELHPISDRGTVDLLREANETYERAVADEERGEHEDAAKEYRHVLNLMEQAELDPTMFYAPRKEFADDLAKAVRGALEKVPQMPEWQDPAFVKQRKWHGFDTALAMAHAASNSRALWAKGASADSKDQYTSDTYPSGW